MATKKEALVVLATREGYRRAGFGFSSSKKKELLKSDLSKDQIEALLADKNLLVSETMVEVPDSAAAKSKDDKGAGK